MLQIHGKLIVSRTFRWLVSPLILSLSLSHFCLFPLWRFASYLSFCLSSLLFFCLPPSLPPSQPLSLISRLPSLWYQRTNQHHCHCLQAYLIAVDLTAHVMISALFNGCACNHFCVFLKEKKKSGRLAVDVIRDLMMCEVVCRPAGSFLEQSGWALINRLKEKVCQSLNVNPVVTDSLCRGVFSSILSFLSDLFISLFSALWFLFNLCLPCLVSFLTFVSPLVFWTPRILYFLYLLLFLSFFLPFFLSKSLFSPFSSFVFLSYILFCHIRVHCEQIISSVSDERHHHCDFELKATPLSLKCLLCFQPLMVENRSMN